jgi:hypothetical protein
MPAGATAEYSDAPTVGHAVGISDVGLGHALADGVFVLGELFDWAVVDDEDPA